MPTQRTYRSLPFHTWWIVYPAWVRDSLWQTSFLMLWFSCWAFRWFVNTKSMDRVIRASFDDGDRSTWTCSIHASLYLRWQSSSRCRVRCPIDSHYHSSLFSSFISISMGLSACNSAGHLSNHADIAPNHAGITFAISNTLATIPGILAGPVTAELVVASHGRWFPVFILASSVNFVGAIIYQSQSASTQILWSNRFDLIV